MNKGLFITFEGPEGSGKSTHSKRVCQELLADGYPAVHTAEPGGTSLGRKVREVLLEKSDIPMGAAAELFLFEADRAQHVEEVIAPALREGKVVICDRFNTATFAYQGYGLGMDMGLVMSMDGAATSGLEPDLTLLLDVDVRTGLERAGSAGQADRMEKREVDFHERVRGGYLEMAAKDPGRIKIISAADGIEHIYGLVKEEVYALVEGHKGSE